MEQNRLSRLQLGHSEEQLVSCDPLLRNTGQSIHIHSWRDTHCGALYGAGVIVKGDMRGCLRTISHSVLRITSPLQQGHARIPYFETVAAVRPYLVNIS